MEDKPIDIILLNYNGLKFTKSCIKSLYKNTGCSFNLIIVDNASTEERTKEYFEAIRKEHDNIIVHYCELPCSFAEGNNIGLTYCKNDFVLLFNNDILIPSTNRLWLIELLNTFKIDQRIAIVGPKLLYLNEVIQSAGSHLAPDAFLTTNCFFHRGRFESREKYSNIDEICCITFACVLAKREILGKIDESYRIGTFEDNDKCMELRKAGYKIFYNGKVELYHYESATLHKLNPQVLTQQILLNQLLFRTRWIEWIRADLEYNPIIYGWRLENKELNK